MYVLLHCKNTRQKQAGFCLPVKKGKQKASRPEEIETRDAQIIGVAAPTC
jgi:hypothetical protein